MTSRPPVLDHAANAYLAVTFSSSTFNPASIAAYAQNLPNSLTTTTPPTGALTYISPVGSLPDIHLFGLPKSAWQNEQTRQSVLDALQQSSPQTGTDGVRVIGVEPVEEPRMRAKRGDEL